MITLGAEEKYGLSGVRLAESLSDEEGAEGMGNQGRKKWTVGISCVGVNRCEFLRYIHPKSCAIFSDSNKNII